MKGQQGSAGNWLFSANMGEGHSKGNRGRKRCIGEEKTLWLGVLKGRKGGKSRRKD